MKEMLFADVTALTTHTKQDLQELINQFTYVWKKFELTINIEKIDAMGKNFKFTYHFTYLISTTNNLLFDIENDKHNNKATAGIAKLSQSTGWQSADFAYQTENIPGMFSWCPTAVNPRWHTVFWSKTSPFLCISSSVKVVFDGWITCIEWMMFVNQNIITVSWPRDTVRKATLHYISMTSARGTWNA